MVTAKSTNKEIFQEFEKQLLTGKAIIVAIQDTKNPEYKSLQVAQLSKVQNESSDEARDLLLGWNKGQVVRTWVNSKVSEAITLGKAVVGMSLDELFTNVAGRKIENVNLVITETFDAPKYMVNGVEKTRNPKVYPTGHPKAGEVITVEGKPVYREVKVDLSGRKHQLLIAKPEAETADINQAFVAQTV